MKVPKHRSNGYEEFGFTLSKTNNKYVAVCRVCNRTLQNTAFVRLRGHRNVCRPPAPDSAPMCSIFVPSEESSYLQNLNEYPFEVGSQMSHSNEQSHPNQNMILTNSVAVENGFAEANINCPPYYNQDQAPHHLQARKKQTNLKKLAVLEVIKKYKHLLLVDEPTVDNAEIWLKVLRKAQSLGIASESRHWSYARDSFEMWKNRTLAKRECADSDGWNDKLDIVDLAILQILEKRTLISPEPVDRKSVCTKDERLSEQLDEVPSKIQEDDGPAPFDLQNKSDNSIKKTNDVSIQTSDEFHEADMKKKRLECEVLELEVYKQRLEALKLERELQLQPSKFTSTLLHSESREPEEKENTASTVKIEFQDNIE